MGFPRFGRLRGFVSTVKDCESSGCEADMAEGSAEEEQSSTAAPASPPADLRILNTQLSPPYQHQPCLQSHLQHRQHSNMLATAVPPRHSHSMLSHQVKTEMDMDNPCDLPLNLKSEGEHQKNCSITVTDLVLICHPKLGTEDVSLEHPLLEV
ncbi:uncharacterized protein LOC122512043 [Leptopilina heterotoma]|uniref:uncharacterized protein LOC122512043 n=1 Tax=Leptopilina heterotoma TaxID=63436 RepID=UPI001CA8D336|nr:uncharacterized protein LOC122512043 [Leptopilina heterotoma]